MKNKIQGMVIGFLVAVMLMSTAAFAASVKKTVTLTYSDLKIIVDGQEIIPKDANGNVVQPFAFEGTNYLPLRALANAFGYPNDEVVWDSATNTVYIGKMPGAEVKLSSLDYFTSEGAAFDYHEQLRVNTGDYYEDCFLRKVAYGGGSRDYLLNGRYAKISGMIFLDYESRSDSAIGKVNIYGDGKLLYSSDEVKAGFMPTPFEVNISGVTRLKIQIEGIFTTYGGGVVLSNVTLY